MKNVDSIDNINSENAQIKVDLLRMVKTLSEQDYNLAVEIAVDFVKAIKQIDSTELMSFINLIDKNESKLEVTNEDAKKIINLIEGVKLLQTTGNTTSSLLLVDKLLQSMKADTLEADSIVVLAQYLNNVPNVEVEKEIKEEKRERLGLFSSLRRGREESYSTLCPGGYNPFVAPTLRGWCSGITEYYYPTDATQAENLCNTAKYVANVGGAIAAATGPVGAAVSVGTLILTPAVAEVANLLSPEAQCIMQNLYNNYKAPNSVSDTNFIQAPEIKDKTILASNTL